MRRPRRTAKPAGDRIETSVGFVKEAAESLALALAGIPFDRAIFFEHARDDDQGNNQNLACTRFVIDGAGRPRRWPQRWQLESPGAAAWMLSDTPWTDDLAAILDRPIDEKGKRLGDLISVKQLRKAKIRALLATAIFEDDRVIGSLMLGSTTPNAYREAERDLLRADEIADVMRDLSAALRKRRRDVLRKMRNMFQPHLPPDVVAAGFVTTLAHENDWDFVGVYRVDRQFALVASCDRTRGSVLKLNPNYRQNLDVGMLGRTLRARKCLRSDDVTTKSASHGYIKVDGFNARSVLCYPIFVSGNVEWILNCASTAHSAFRGPDREMLDELVDGLQLTVNLWFETRLSTAILDGLTEPVVVTDREGTIQRANRAGRAVFGLMAGGPTSLADFAVDEAGRRLLQPDRTVSSDCVTMMTAMQQEPRDFIVTSSLPSEAFGQLVYKFSDKREQEWLAGLDHARQVVETEVGQARAVLMLASALVSRARAELRAGEVFDSVDKTLLRASEAISKTDLSYGRLVQATTGKTDGGANRFVLNTLVEMASAALAAPAPSSGIAGTSPDATIAKAIVAIARRLIGGAAGARATLDALPGVKTP